jgi:hypothetical protein
MEPQQEQGITMSKSVEWSVQREHRSGNKISVRNPTQAEARAIYDNAELGPNDVKVSLIREESCVEAYKPIAPPAAPSEEAEIPSDEAGEHEEDCPCFGDDVPHSEDCANCTCDRSTPPLESGKATPPAPEIAALPELDQECRDEITAIPKRSVYDELDHVRAILRCRERQLTALRVSLPSELDKLAHSLAFENAVTIIDSESIHALSEDWQVVDVEGEVYLVDALRYLELRGLLERHPEHKDWVRVIDESEATA